MGTDWGFHPGQDVSAFGSLAAFKTKESHWLRKETFYSRLHYRIEGGFPDQLWFTGRLWSISLSFSLFQRVPSWITHLARFCRSSQGCVLC